jgi:hypothetical protein
MFVCFFRFKESLNICIRNEDSFENRDSLNEKDHYDQERKRKRKRKIKEKKTRKDPDQT